MSAANDEPVELSVDKRCTLLVLKSLHAAFALYCSLDGC